MQLRPYQTDLIEEIRYSIRAGLSRICTEAPCGSGKTVILSWITAQSRAKGQKILIVVHRQELIEQTAKTLDEFHIRYEILNSRNINSCDMHIASIQTLARRLDQFERPPDLIILDECFVAGTMVGNKPIEQLKVGDIVPCFDEDTRQIKYSKVTQLFKNPAQEGLLRISIHGKQSIVCTPNHPIFTMNGWVKAKDIREGGFVYVCVSTMRRTDENKESSKVPTVLQEGFNRAQSQGISIKDDGSESNAKSKIQRENDQYSKKDTPQTISKRRQWKGKYGSPRDVSNGLGLDEHGVYTPHQDTSRPRISHALQNRHSESNPQDSRRSRRIFALRAIEKTARRKEKRILKVARVDCVEIFQQGCSDEFTKLCPDGFVYNIEVERYNTYFANGLAVHNCHHATANTWRKVIDHFPKALVIGFTATPARLSGDGLGVIFQALALGPSVRELIDMGNLSPFEYYSPPVVADFADLKVKYGDYQKADVALKMDKSEIIGDVIDTYRKLADGKRAIVYCASCEHAEHVAREFNHAGIPAAYIDGKTQDAIRKTAIEQFRTGVVKILTNVDLVSEGFDVPNMECVILLRPTQSVVLFIQQAMRAMRADPDNPEKVAVIIDHVGNVYRHGLPDEDREWSLEGKVKKREPNEISVRQCPECYFTHLPRPRCPHCGYMYAVQAPEPIKQTKGELLQIKALERAEQKREIGKARTREDLEQIAITRGYSLRWVDKILAVRSGQRR